MDILTELLPRGVGIWSVDSILKPKEFNSKRFKSNPKSLIRLVHFHSDFKKHSGVRYILADQKIVETGTFDFGAVVSINNKVFKNKIPESYVDKLSVLPWVTVNEKELLEPMVDLQQKMSNDITELFVSAKIAKNEYLPDLNAKPLCCNELEIWARIYVHNVGQGDTIVLELPNNQIWMIDAYFTGRKKSDFEKWYNRKFGKRHLTRLIITHFHYDHIYSVPYIIDGYHPDQVVVMNSLSHTTTPTQRILDYAGDKLMILPSEETTIMGKLQIQLHRTDKFSNVYGSKNPNDHEISIAMKTGTSFAFLAGDIPAWMCEDLCRTSFFQGGPYKICFYKVSHHGSISGFSDHFFSHLNHNESIVSCGLKNRYGHPNDPPNGVLKNKKFTYSYGVDPYFAIVTG